MRITRRSTLVDVALAVGDALRRHEIKAVLSGGACASMYTRGAYQSVDIDYVLEGRVTQRALDAAMETIGFSRRRDHYVHPRSPFFVEFPRGPLSIGEDAEIRPVLRRSRGLVALVLSPTDSCRDRLAAFYHWKDRQSLAVAVEIARNHAVRLTVIRRWSEAEDASAGFEEFQKGLRERGREARGRRGARA